MLHFFNFIYITLIRSIIIFQYLSIYLKKKKLPMNEFIVYSAWVWWPSLVPPISTGSSGGTSLSGGMRLNEKKNPCFLIEIFFQYEYQTNINLSIIKFLFLQNSIIIKMKSLKSIVKAFKVITLTFLLSVRRDLYVSSENNRKYCRRHII
jgi:hypothetical protein